MILIVIAPQFLSLNSIYSPICLGKLSQIFVESCPVDPYSDLQITKEHQLYCLFIQPIIPLKFFIAPSIL